MARSLRQVPEEMAGPVIELTTRKFRLQFHSKLRAKERCEGRADPRSWKRNASPGHLIEFTVTDLTGRMSSHVGDSAVPILKAEAITGLACKSDQSGEIAIEAFDLLLQVGITVYFAHKRKHSLFGHVEPPCGSKGYHADHYKGSSSTDRQVGQVISINFPAAGQFPGVPPFPDLREHCPSVECIGLP